MNVLPNWLPGGSWSGRDILDIVTNEPSLVTWSADSRVWPVREPGVWGPWFGSTLRARLMSQQSASLRPLPGRTIVEMTEDLSAVQYEPMPLARLASFLRPADERLRWRYIAEFLEEFSWEPPVERLRLLAEAPATTGDERWDTFLAALAEYLAARDGRGTPEWVGFRPLRRFWFPFNTRAARADAIVHAPAAFRSRGIYVSPQELAVA